MSSTYRELLEHQEIEPESAAWPSPADPVLPGHESVYRRLEQLEAAHALLLRYANDLKCAYEAERERRTGLAQATLDLLMMLSTALAAVPPAGEPAAP